MVADGDLIQVIGRTEIYVIENGIRRLIPNMETFFDWDFAKGAVYIISEAELNAIPLGVPLPSSKRFDFELYTNLGANHHMYTKGTMSSRTGKVRSSTRTWTGTWFGGFHGGVTLLFLDAEDIAVGQSAMNRFGVDGTVIGRSDRTDYWEEDITPEVVQRTAIIRVIHAWAPDDLLGVINRVISLAEPIIKFIKDIQKSGAVGGPTTAKTSQALVASCMAGGPDRTCPAGQPQTPCPAGKPQSPCQAGKPDKIDIDICPAGKPSRKPCMAGKPENTERPGIRPIE